ncbi:hypothetical protein TWF281_011647 [Arthrobotrys megalospora]
MVKGIRINCKGDQQVCNRPKYEEVEVPLTDPIFSDHDTSGITERLGVPIFTRKYPKDPAWEKLRCGGIPHIVNQEATLLHLSCDPDEKFDLEAGFLGFGWAPKKWQYGAGSVLVVRQDGKPLTPLHMEALCKYCRDHVHPIFGHVVGEFVPDEPLSKEAALSMVCRPTFSIFWFTRFKAEDTTNDEGQIKLATLYED